jgi:hypothetical protein
MKINYISDASLKIRQAPVKGEFVLIEGEQYYKIWDYDRMSPFFMSIVSNSDHWLFISSKGGLTAGRRNPENALFPYVTDDKIHDASDNTGSKTLIYIETSDKYLLWEPFSDAYRGIYNIQRNIYKNTIGNKIMFEEINFDLRISFHYLYCNSEKFGLVKKSIITNHADFKRRITLLDGLQNILPAGVNRSMQTGFSTLVDAYKKNELLIDEGIAIYALSSIPIDKAEPNEALRCSIAWSVGLDNTQYLLSGNQIDKFRIDRTIKNELEMHGTRGAYFLWSQLVLPDNSIKEWYTVLDINKDIAGILEIKELFTDKASLYYEISNDINKGSGNLVKIVGNADGLQLTADKLISSRHFSNVLFNVMRGGIFDNNYLVERKDFSLFLNKTNAILAKQYGQFLRELPQKLLYSELSLYIESTNDPQFRRIFSEYLPLTFSRRHGDPSRPWNVFSIDIKKEDGSKILSYQGNWRDIFQNWEALSFSFPGFIESMISKFVNATTADGYNPYRLMREGFEWEVLDPQDPWSNIGYWGDHQIIYLLKLLELSGDFHPGILEKMMVMELFSYAYLPYRIKKYDDLLKNPYDSIVFDQELNKRLLVKASAMGADGKLVFSGNDQPYLVSLTEKFLVLILAKLSNFVPEGGIWMNTQRPEWNDANNALVGRGLSMVTLFYLRRFVQFFSLTCKKMSEESIMVSDEVTLLFRNVNNIIIESQSAYKEHFNDQKRKQLMDKLGTAGSNFRELIYIKSFSGKKQSIAFSEITGFCNKSISLIDRSINANRREDGLYHSYNLMSIKTKNAVSIEHLYEMLEGQVAILSAGYASASDSLQLLEAMKQSLLFRPDQNSYMLYPRRRLQPFMEKNVISEADFGRSELLPQLLKDGNTSLIARDRDGKLHFQNNIRNVNVLEEILAGFASTVYKIVAKKENELIHEIYENVFHHSSFTGRSGTFYKYEGLGSIYWHMVSKLLLAVRDLFYSALENHEEERIISGLKKFYYEIKEGIGVHKTPAQYGAFPTDPYSHTPAHAGVQQPGMTGQVKEDILCRFGELGLLVKEGRIRFNTSLLRTEEFLNEPDIFNYFDANGNPQSIELEKDMLAFTFCQVPVIYKLSDISGISLTSSAGSISKLKHLFLSLEDSQHIFRRDGDIIRIDVSVVK